ncbi:MAG: A/G-specific adenine glycosylase, partial [Paracoccaceae bacterium]
MPETALSHSLLDWYDRHARVLPWRIAPGPGPAKKPADPYRVWLSEIMLQQTTVAAVTGYYQCFTDRWPDVSALANARESTVMEMWAGLGYYARARNLVKCARLVTSRHRGVFPDNAEDLQKLPGIGPYTAAAIAAIAFDRAEAVVDGNVERVMARLFHVTTPLPGAKPELNRHAARL